MVQKYVLLPTGKTMADLALNPKLAQQYADCEMEHIAGAEWVLNDVELIIELTPEPEPGTEPNTVPQWE